jgi:aromatic-L-amino-acid decarboxylase
MSPEEFRKEGHALVDWLADVRAEVYAGAPPVMAQIRPGWLKEQLPLAPPEGGDGFEAIAADMKRLLPAACSHFVHPRFFGYFPSNSELASVLADFAATALSQLGLNWGTSPALAEIEEVALDWLRQAIGLEAAWQGVIQDTASSSTLVALLCARERASDLSSDGPGLRGAGPRLAVYASRYAHSSVDKAALLAGFGRDNLRKIEVDASFALDPEALARAMGEDAAQGIRPACVVATVGTTTTTAVDPVRACAEIARRHGAWLHVDAALAGAAMLLPEMRPLWDGVEAADSLVLNPHKWLGAAFDCSAYYVRDPSLLVRVMSTSPSYLKTADDGEVRNYRDWGVPLGRRMRGLKLWALLRERGLERLRARLRRDMENARWLAGELRAAKGWRVLAPVAFQTVCARHEPEGVEGDALDAHTRAWVERINASGRAYLTTAQLEGRWMARVSIGALPTEREHVAELWALMREAAG